MSNFEKTSVENAVADEPLSEVPSFYDRYIFPEPPDLIAEEEHDSMLV